MDWLKHQRNQSLSQGDLRVGNLRNWHRVYRGTDKVW